MLFAPHLVSVPHNSRIECTIRNISTSLINDINFTFSEISHLDFTLAAETPFQLESGDAAVFLLKFLPQEVGERFAKILISSQEFDGYGLEISGIGVSLLDDTDADGMNNEAEYALASLGFDWQAPNTELVQTLIRNAHKIGLYSEEQIQVLNISNPLISKNATNGDFELTVGIQKSTDLQSFEHFSLNNTDTTIEPDGRLKIRFSVPDNAAFFRLQSE
jgi:hypothetical protein